MSLVSSSEDHKATAQPFGLYIHIPFCARKCPYCDFNTYAGLENLHERTVDALCTELHRWGKRMSGRSVTSVFIGGGTPTVMTPELLTRLLETLHRAFELDGGCEFTVEANPGTVDREKFSLLRSLGVNRLSLGVQSFQTDELSFLGRIHNVDDIYVAFDAARDAGVDNINLDFIFGLPKQRRRDWEDTLDKAIALKPEHLSLYSLIVEEGTPLNDWVRSGQVSAPDEDEAGAMYETAFDRLGGAGYSHYEVSNWAVTSNLGCQHNLLYWRNGEYVGIGPGAHSHMRYQNASGEILSRRWGNVKPVPDYIERIELGRSIAAFQEELTASESMGECLMLGLRLVKEGVELHRFAALYGVSMHDVYGRELDRLQKNGLLVVDEERVRLTQRGLMMGNQVFMEFLPDAVDSGSGEAKL